MLVVFGLLWAFQQVASDSVQQSELRLKAIRAFNHATWRCNSLSATSARETCLSQRPALTSATVPEPKSNPFTRSSIGLPSLP